MSLSDYEGLGISPASSPVIRAVTVIFSALFLSIIVNIAWQILPKRKSEPPMVFHWIPFIGNAVSYGIDPFRFYTESRKKVRGKSIESDGIY